MNKQLLTLVIALFGLSVFTNAVAIDPAHISGEIELRTPTIPGDASVFGYSGTIGPEYWEGLPSASKQHNAVCAKGTAQSPIDFEQSVIEEGNEGDIVIDYSPSQLMIENLGTTIEFPYDDGSYIEIDDGRYELLQFHLHTPSEHTIGGAYYPLEIHLVHRLSDSRFAVLGIMVMEGQANAALGELGDELTIGQLIPRIENVGHTFKSLHIDAEKLLPEDRSFYRYDGSLTTPPCSEVVLWSVFTQPIEMSNAQITVLREALGDLRYVGHGGQNNRPIQPATDREVTINR